MLEIKNYNLFIRKFLKLAENEKDFLSYKVLNNNNFVDTDCKLSTINKLI